MICGESRRVKDLSRLHVLTHTAHVQLVSQEGVQGLDSSAANQDAEGTTTGEQVTEGKAQAEGATKFFSSVTRMRSMEDLWKDSGGSGEVVAEEIEEVSAVCALACVRSRERAMQSKSYPLMALAMLRERAGRLHDCRVQK